MDHLRVACVEVQQHLDRIVQGVAPELLSVRRIGHSVSRRPLEQVVHQFADRLVGVLQRQRNRIHRRAVIRAAGHEPCREPDRPFILENRDRLDVAGLFPAGGFGNDAERIGRHLEHADRHILRDIGRVEQAVQWRGRLVKSPFPYLECQPYGAVLSDPGKCVGRAAVSAVWQQVPCEAIEIARQTQDAVRAQHLGERRRRHAVCCGPQRVPRGERPCDPIANRSRQASKLRVGDGITRAHQSSHEPLTNVGTQRLTLGLGYQNGVA